MAQLNIVYKTQKTSKRISKAAMDLSWLQPMDVFLARLGTPSTVTVRVLQIPVMGITLAS